jgi:hypothetical protein
LWWYEGDFCLGGGGLVVCRWGELWLGRRRRNRGGEGRWTYINFYRCNIHRWNSRWFWRNNRHITAWICHFKSISDSVWKNNPPKPPRQRPIFFTTEMFPSVIQSVTTDGNCPSVVTDWMTDGILFVSNFNPYLPTEIFRR